MSTQVVEFQTKKAAEQITCPLSKPSKMPGFSYGLPALDSCPVGKKLAKIPGSICSKCYALRGNYSRYPAIRIAQFKRMAATERAEWVPAMVKLIKGQKHFRIHDSGDFYSLEYFRKWIAVAAACPDTQFWAPTREKGMIARYLKAGGYIPENLTIRLSAAMVDSAAPDIGIPTSTVHAAADPIGYKCPAPENNGECGDCRACWNKSIANVSYGQH